MNYIEFKEFKDVTDNKFIKKFADNDGNSFYIEPAFYTQFQGLLTRFPEHEKAVVEMMKEIVKRNKCVAFVYDYENPFLDYKDAVLREFVDITDACKIFFEDKSRGSDYGD